MKDLRQRLRATFQVEHTEHVQRIREILAVCASADGAAAAPDLDEVFRRAHSLKGAARAVDLRPIEQLSHRLETLFSRVREGAVALDRSAIKVIHQALDASEDWLAASDAAHDPAEPAEALEAIDALLGTRPAAARAVVAAAPAPPSAAVPTPLAPASLAQVDTVRLSAGSLDRIVSSAGQLLTESLRQHHVTRQLRNVSQHLSETAAERDRIRKSGARVFQRLDSSPELAVAARYINYLDHQIHLLTKQVAAAVQLQSRNAWTLRSLAGELQRDVRQARMVPAENVFDGFRKMVRDLAKDAGKSIDLHVAGWQVEADRLVLQALKDPVMHMLRNAVSHGLEPEAERRAQGKASEGRIDLTLEVRGNRLHIVVEDDGRGIDVARVSEIALRKGLISESEQAARTPAELTRLVLLPGFSTSRVVSDLSGRGMGLSVVAQAVARLQGAVDIGPGRRGGTRVALSAPLSVSSHRVTAGDVSGPNVRDASARNRSPSAGRHLRRAHGGIQTGDDHRRPGGPGGEPRAPAEYGGAARQRQPEHAVRDGDARRQPASRGRGRRVSVGARRDHQRAPAPGGSERADCRRHSARGRLGVPCAQSVGARRGFSAVADRAGDRH